MKRYISIVLAFCAILILGGCLIDGEERHYLYLTIYPFDTKETYGLYILNDRGVVLKSNIPITTSDEGEAVIRDWEDINKDGNVFFLYSPYIPEPEEMPVKGDTVYTRDPMEFFEGLRTRTNIHVARGKAGQCGTHIEIFNMIDTE